MTRDDIVAALGRMVQWNERDSDGSRSDAALLRALADALQEVQMQVTQDGVVIAWLIPEPKVKP